MKRLLADIGDAIRGREFDYTKIKLGKAILLLAIPMVMEMIMESVFVLLDTKFVSLLAAPDEAIAVVGLTESVLTLIYAISIGIAMGTTGIVARRIGEKHDRAASIAGGQAIILGALISLAIAVPGVIYAEKTLSLMHAEKSVIDNGVGFTRIMLGGNVVIMLLFINNAIFRSAGKPALSMWVLLIANLINIILDPCLIFGLGPFPEMGVRGAALATTIGRGTAVLIQFYLLFSGASRITLRISDLVPRLQVVWRVLYLSGGGIFQYFVATSSWLFLYRILAVYKSEVIAGYTVAIRLFIFFLLPAWGISNAAATLVGQNLGASDPKRAERSVWKISLVNSVYMALTMLILLLLPHKLVGFYIEPGTVAYEVGITCLQIMGLGMVFYGFEMIIAQAFNGAGDTYTPTALNIIGFWLVQIPLASYLAHKAGMEENGVFWAIFISEALIAVLGVIVFRMGRWKTHQV